MSGSLRALILFKIFALCKSFTYLLTYLLTYLFHIITVDFGMAIKLGVSCPFLIFFAPIYIAEVVEDVLQALSLLRLVLVEWSLVTLHV